MSWPRPTSEEINHSRPRFSRPSNDRPKFRLKRPSPSSAGHLQGVTYQDSGNYSRPRPTPTGNLNVTKTNYVYEETEMRRFSISTMSESFSRPTGQSETDQIQEYRPRPTEGYTRPRPSSVSFSSTFESSGHIASHASEMDRDNTNGRLRLKPITAVEVLEEDVCKSTPSRKRSLVTTPSSQEETSQKSRRICSDYELGKPLPEPRQSEFRKRVVTFKEAPMPTSIANGNRQTSFGQTKGQDRLKILREKLEKDQQNQNPLGPHSYLNNSVHGQSRQENAWPALPSEQRDAARISHQNISSMDNVKLPHRPKPSLNTEAPSFTMVSVPAQDQHSPLSSAGEKRGAKHSRPIEKDGPSLHKKARVEHSQDEPKQKASAQDRLHTYQNTPRQDTSETRVSIVTSTSATLPSGSINREPGMEPSVQLASLPRGRPTSRPLSRIAAPRTTPVRSGTPDGQQQTTPRPPSSTSRRKSRIAAPKSSSDHSVGTNDGKKHLTSESLQQPVSPPHILQSGSCTLNSSWCSDSQQPIHNITQQSVPFSGSHTLNSSWSTHNEQPVHNISNQSVSPLNRPFSDSHSLNSSWCSDNEKPDIKSAQPSVSPLTIPVSDSRTLNSSWHSDNEEANLKIAQKSIDPLNRPLSASYIESNNQLTKNPVAYTSGNHRPSSDDGGAVSYHNNGTRRQLPTNEYDMDWEPSTVELKVVLNDALNIRQQLSAEPILDEGTSAPVQEDYHIVIDTNIFLAHLKFVELLRDTQFEVLGSPKLVVSWIVLQELDGLKVDKFKKGFKTNPVTQMQAIKAIRWINYSFTHHPDLIQGDEGFAENAVDNMLRGDDNLIVTCLNLKRAAKNVLLLTNDVNLRNKASMLKIPSRSKDELDDELRRNTVQKFSIFYKAKTPTHQKQQTLLKSMKGSLTKALGQV